VEALTPGLRASPIPRRAAGQGTGKRPCLLNGLERRGGDGGTRGDRGVEAPVTEIIDRCQQAVMLARELLLQGLGFLGM
jgi:hypothetical protein